MILPPDLWDSFMEYNVQINITRSIDKRRIVFKNFFRDKIDPILSYILITLYTGFPLFFIIKILHIFKNSGDRNFIIILLSSAIIFLLDMIYKIATERKLTYIKTGVEKTEAYKAVKDYIEHSDWYIVEYTQGYIRASDSDTWSVGTSIRVFFFDNYILLNVMSNFRRRGHIPAILSYRWVAKDLSNHINNFCFPK